MNATRISVFIAVILSIGIAAIGWIVGIQPKLQEASRADADRVAAEQTNVTYEIALVDLKKQFEQIDELDTDLADLQEAVPFTYDEPALLEELNALAAATGTTVVDVTFDEARAYGAPAPVEPATDDATAEGEDAATTEEPAPQPATTTPATAPAVYSDPRITGTNFVALPISISVSGSYSGVLAYLEQAQSMKRLFLVSGISMLPGDAAALGPDAGFNGVLTGYVYVLVDPIGQAKALEELASTDEG